MAEISNFGPSYFASSFILQHIIKVSQNFRPSKVMGFLHSTH